MALPKLLLSLVLTWVFFMSMAMARAPPTDRTLAARLQESSSMDCWNSLMELRACTGEVILFFMNGETYLGPSCCKAIRVIEHQCWPTMLLSLGYTSEEGDVLKDYCDDALDSSPLPPSGPEAPVKPTTRDASGEP